MKKLQNYILMELLGPFAAITIGLSAIALLTQSLTNLDLLIERGQSPWTLLSISLLGMPQFMAIVTPISLFVTVANVYGRLYSENEIVVAFAGGQSKFDVALPAIRLSIIAAIFVLFINVFVQPITYQSMRSKLFAIRTDMATTLVRESQFREPVNGLTIYSRKIKPDGTMQGLMISDSREINNPTIYVAESGGIVKISGQPAISMRNGSVHRRKNDGQVDILGFSQYLVELAGFAFESGEFMFKAPDRNTWDLFKPDKTSYWDDTNFGKVLAEGHRRFSSPLYALVCTILALYAILGSEYSRRGYGGKVGRNAAYAIIILLIGSAIQGPIEKNANLNWLQYVIPISVFVFFAAKLHFFKIWRVNGRFVNLRKLAAGAV